MTAPKHLAIASVLACLLAAPARGATDIRIDHVTIISPERTSPQRDALVIIHDGRIAVISTGKANDSAPPGTKVIDGRGLFLTPGLIDSHVHLDEIPGMTAEQEASHPDIARETRDQIPRSYLLHGFTTLIDLASAPQNMAKWKSRDLTPDTYFCGGAALMDGYPMAFAPKPERYRVMPYMLIEAGSEPPPGIDPALHTPSAVVARMKADGAICVKTYFERGFGPMKNLPVPKAETIRDVIRAAHAAGLPVLMHANAAEAQAFGVAAGVDILAHGLWNGPPDTTTSSVAEILDGVVAKNIGWQPTIQVLYGERDLFDPSFLSDPALARALPQSLLDWYRTPEGQWFHDILADEMQTKDKDAATAQAQISKNFAKPIGRVHGRRRLSRLPWRAAAVWDGHAQRADLCQPARSQRLAGNAAPGGIGRDAGADIQGRNPVQRPGAETGS